jgi:restriction system protein
MKEEVKRIPIYKYIKSRRLSGISSNSKFKGYTIIDMSTDLRKIEKIRSVKYVKLDSIISTGYILEAIENIQKVSREEYSFSYRFLRILTKEDLGEEKWKNTKLLTDLPVGAHPHISKEEELWAGKREGNIGAGIALFLWVLATWWWLYRAIMKDEAVIFAAIVALVSTFFLVIFKWHPAKKANAEKLAELRAYKEQLRKNADLKQEKAKTELEKLLEDYSNWEKLSPEEFEHALTFKLKKDGYDLHVTKYVGDGGVDLEGVNDAGEPIIVQAKKYSSNVGVAVVREMIGIRESHPEKPLTMIISLVGFTKGSLQLAKQEGVILKSLKKDILRI